MSFYKAFEQEFKKDKIKAFKAIMPEVIIDKNNKDVVCLYEFHNQLRLLDYKELDEFYFDKIEKFIHSDNKKQILLERIEEFDRLKFKDFIIKCWNDNY